MLNWEHESLILDWCRKFWIMCWLFMGLVFGCVVDGRVSGEYDIQFSGFL